MNDKVHPKRVIFLMEMLYKDHPSIKNHPDYKIYYLFTDYPEISEYIFVVTIQYLIDSEFTDNVNNSLKNYKNLFSFTECSVINEFDFEIVLKQQLTSLQEKLRGTNFNITLYEVW